MISDPGVLVSSKIPDCALCQVLPRWVSQGRKRYVPSPGCLDGAKSNVEAFLAPLFASAVETRWLTCKFVPHCLPAPVPFPHHPIPSFHAIEERDLF
jgi:hypothetical protein